MIGALILIGLFMLTAALLASPISRVTARIETLLMVRAMESLAVAAQACHALDEGRERERLLYALRERLDAAGIPDSGHDEHPELGPRGVFKQDGTYETPDGTAWDFAQNGGTTQHKIEQAARVANDVALEDGYRAAGNP